MDINENIPVTTGRCPTCNDWNIGDEKSFISKGIPVYNNTPECHYSWDEVHICPKCKTIYQFNNGT